MPVLVVRCPAVWYATAVLGGGSVQIIVLACILGSGGGELALVLTGGSSGGAAQSAVEAALREQGLEPLTMDALRRAVGAEALEAVKSCADEACVAEFAVTLGARRAFVGRYEPRDRRLRLVELDGRGSKRQETTTAWDGSAAAAAEAARQAIARLLGVAAPEPKAETPAPPETDLRGRVRFLAHRLREGYARTASTPAIHRIAVIDFDNVGNDAQAQRLGAVVAEVLVTEMASTPGVIVVERNKLKELVSELKLQKTSDLDPRTATEIGKFLGAGSMIVGSVTEAGAQYLLNARQVSVETAAVIQAESVPVDRGELVALSEELVEVKSQAGAALRSALLPGWGQLYNGDTGVGLTFLGTGLAAGAAAATFGYLYKKHADLYHENEPDTVGSREDGNRYASLTTASLLAYGVIWAINIAHAYATGRDAATVNTPDGGAAVLAPAF